MLGDNETLPSTAQTPQCNDRNRQHVSCVLPKQTGRNQISFTHGTHNQDIALVSGKSNNSPSTSYPRTIQRDQRSVVSPGPSCQYRMVTSSVSYRGDQPDLGAATSRPFRHPLQSQAPSILLADTRPTGPRCGQHVSLMVQPDRVCLPSTSHSTESPEQNQVRQVHSVPDCSSLELPELVPHPPEPPNRSTQKNPTKKKPIKATHVKHVPSVTTSAQLTRVEVIRRHLSNKGFSKEAAYSISQRCRKATNNLYEARWRIYARWCAKRKIDPLSISTPQLANFLEYLATDLHKGLSAIQGYRAVINSTIHLCKNKEPGNNVYINSLIRSHKITQPTQDSQIPKWNLNLVLNSLTEAPYEPLLSASLKHLTWKTAFLVAFATAARVGELKAIDSKHVAHTESWSKVTLQTHPSFIAKNQDLAVDGKPRRFTIPALYDFAGPDLPDRLLCPVRALRLYLSRVKPLRNKHKRALFISFDKRHQGEITSNTIASWIKNVIRTAYSTTDEEKCELGRVSAHEVRALAASVHFQRNLSLASLNQACYWRGHSTFTNYYLRDITLHKNGELQLPHVIAASCKIAK